MHKVFLKTICLNSPDEIDKFLKSIDHNPDPRYLASVKQISIREDSEEQLLPVQYRISKDDIKKLFLRFPNLEKIQDSTYTDFTMYSEFDDEICEQLLSSCPKLHSFTTSNGFVNYGHLLKLRRVMTKIDLTSIKEEATYDTIATSYVTSFSRLKSLSISSQYLNTFEAFLPVFERLPKLTKLKVYNMQQDQDKFAERYLATRTEEEQDLLLERLSKVVGLTWGNWSGICVNTLTFIIKHLTGLKRLSLYGAFTDRSRVSRQQHRLFCNSMLDLFNSISQCHVNIKLRMNDLSEYLPLILHKVYQQLTTNDKSRKLELIVTDAYDGEATDLVELNIMRLSNGQRCTLIKMKGEHSLNNLITNVLSETTQLDDVDFFKFHPLGSQAIDASVYEKLLGWIKSLNHVYLNIPSSFKENEIMHYTYDQEYKGSVYIQVEEMTTDTSKNVTYQTLLNRFSFAFPNIKRLNFHYHSGFWQQHLGEFQLTLCKYSLKHLKVDVTPIRRMMRSYIEKQCATDEDFFLLEIEVLDTGKRHSYKVTPYSLSTTKSNGDDLQGLVRGKDYFRLHITVNNLEQLELYISNCTFFTGPVNYMEFGGAYLTRIIALNA